jgi:hypothetical protein
MMQKQQEFHLMKKQQGNSSSPMLFFDECSRLLNYEYALYVYNDGKECKENIHSVLDEFGKGLKVR